MFGEVHFSLEKPLSSIWTNLYWLTMVWILLSIKSESQFKANQNLWWICADFSCFKFNAGLRSELDTNSHSKFHACVGLQCHLSVSSSLGLKCTLVCNVTCPFLQVLVYFSLPLHLVVGYTYPNVIQYYLNNANSLSFVAAGIVSTIETVAWKATKAETFWLNPLSWTRFLRMYKQR